MAEDKAKRDQLVEQLADVLKRFMECQAGDGTKCAPNDSDFFRGRVVLAKVAEGRE